MKTCKLCNQHLKPTKIIDGRKIRRTKYCFSCVPYKSIKYKGDIESYSGRGLGKRFKCKSCNNDFPMNTTINGIRIQRKTHCLTCLPHGQNVNKKFNRRGEKIKCQRCEVYYIYGKKANKRLDICNKCYWVNIRLKFKIKAIKYKGGKCENCGYNKSINAMTFHHKNPNNKSFNISSVFNWEKLKSELNKCKLLCYNCHMEEHEDSNRLKAIQCLSA